MASNKVEFLKRYMSEVNHDKSSTISSKLLLKRKGLKLASDYYKSSISSSIKISMKDNSNMNDKKENLAKYLESKYQPLKKKKSSDKISTNLCKVKIKTRHDSDASMHDNDISPTKNKTRFDSDDENDDISKNKLIPENNTKAFSFDNKKKNLNSEDYKDYSKPSKIRYHSSDSDNSPMRQNNQSMNTSQIRNIKIESEDLSPPRRKKTYINEQELSPARKKIIESDLSRPIKNKKTYNSDQDLSPVRKNRNDSLIESYEYFRRDRSRSPINRRNENTNADQNLYPHRRITNEYSGLVHNRNNSINDSNKKLEVIYRDKSGKKRNFEEEKIRKSEEEAKRTALEAKYKEWNRGLKQKEDKNATIKDYLVEADKPLARYSDDVDLDKRLKEVDRAGDPMLEYMQKRKSQKTSGSVNAIVKPVYKGPEPPPNRYNIRPGYRWDGVDRTNGFEKQYFLKCNERKMVKDMAYKWSTEDM